MRQLLVAALLISFFFISKAEAQTKHEAHSASDSLLLSPQEMKYLKNIKQLTFGGNNAEAYWSFDDSMLVFQSDYSAWGAECDQVYYVYWREDDLKNLRETLSIQEMLGIN